MAKRVLVAGGDGFIGWPLSLSLSAAGYEVLIVDSLLRRRLVEEVGATSLIPIGTMAQRLAAWHAIEPKAAQIAFRQMNIAETPELFCRLLAEFQPETVVHLATIPSAPYSMKSTETGMLTLQNNITCTWGVLNGVVESQSSAAIVHIGTMGVYGYDVEDYDIPEGYLNIETTTRDGKKKASQVLHPMKPGSLYHVTKAQDQLLFDFYNRLYVVRATDLHQGIVWGMDTELTSRDSRLATRLDYDSDFGTVLNRFAVQTAMNIPVTVYGSGGQKRTFIHLADSVKCLMLAIENPPGVGERVRIFNQFAQVLSISEIADILHDLSGANARLVENPRIEKEDNQLRAKNEGLRSLGWEPTTLSSDLMLQLVEIAKKYKDRLSPDVIQPMSFWRHRAK